MKISRVIIFWIIVPLTVIGFIFNLQNAYLNYRAGMSFGQNIILSVWMIFSTAWMYQSYKWQRLCHEKDELLQSMRKRMEDMDNFMQLVIDKLNAKPPKSE